MAEWQPIETAPKDRRVIVVDADGRVEIAYWQENPRVWEDQPQGPCWTVFEPEDYFYAYHLIAHPPTHWMPLPEPPK